MHISLRFDSRYGDIFSCRLHESVVQAVSEERTAIDLIERSDSGTFYRGSPIQVTVPVKVTVPVGQ